MSMAPAPQVSSSNPDLNELIQRYIDHWKTITQNAASAREKQGKYEEAKREEKNKEVEVKETREQEKQLAQTMNGNTDELAEAQYRALKLKLESAKASHKAATLQCQMLEAEVKAMKLQHEKNVHYEKKLQVDFSQVCNKDQEQVKKCIIFARQQAQASSSSSGPSSSGPPPSMPPQGSPPTSYASMQQPSSQSMNGRFMEPPHMQGRQSSSGKPGPQTVAALSADRAVQNTLDKKKKNASKEPRKTKGKDSGKKAAASGADSYPTPSDTGNGAKYIGQEEEERF